MLLCPASVVRCAPPERGGTQSLVVVRWVGPLPR